MLVFGGGVTSESPLANFLILTLVRIARQDFHSKHMRPWTPKRKNFEILLASHYLSVLSTPRGVVFFSGMLEAFRSNLGHFISFLLGKLFFWGFADRLRQSSGSFGTQTVVLHRSSKLENRAFGLSNRPI